ncbi:SUMF1/EgtB/PvdO family nonheme iron enzyme, partial [Myxococcota bacterium]|nr:SUMF1/EgtB/PvdO family nonheme iron enzyme [Myxococcota bacterium]
GCEYLCTFTNGGVERCDDGIDNDCDGTTDEFNSATDVMNCGSCGHVCETSGPPNMTTTGCLAGVCQYTCAANYYDYTAAPGCEYYCVVSNGGTEACDGLDNDCDNSIDETFNTATDILNCGGCGYACAAHAPTNMTATGCVTGNCTFACVANTYNYDGLLSNGCEYACTVTNGGVEICDNLDNDCDGIKDEGVSGTPLEQSCYSGPGGTEGVGVCHAGTQKCFSGVWNACQGQVLPQTELCDTVDNDCDGTPDDGYNLNTDILNCGMCGNSCFANVSAHASVSSCSTGACVYTCNAGYYDDDGDLANPAGNGCEYACEATLPAGSEDCNGLDDDCDGDIDEVSDLIPPPLSYCKTGGACGSSVSSLCQDFGGSTLWVCQYPTAVDRLAGSPNKVAYAEVRCDNLDNDCNGSVDEDFLPIKGAACEDGDFGLCKGTGTVVCKGDLSGTECNITAKGTAQPETCDAIDNDCDGLTDETAWNPGTNPFYVEDDVEIVTVGGVDVLVYRYEASRPAATAVNPGVGNPRACSRPDVLPWNRVTYAQAQAACSLAGARLCTSDEWQEACEGTVGLVYPYGNTYEGMTCNGRDYLLDISAPTGDAMDCFSAETGTFDMSGNLREWTMDYRGQTSASEKLFTLRGGSYLEYENGLTCQFTGSVYVESAFTAHVGFRCCSTCGNGTIEADELCDDGNRVNGDGCDWFCAPTAGQTCGNGVREGSEVCDDGNRIGGDGCSPSCRLDGIPVCGNGVVEGNELCDDGNRIDGDGCQANCTLCGNGVVDANETCDDGNLINGDGCESNCRRCAGSVLDAFGYERCPGGATFTSISGTGTKLGNGDEGSYSITMPFTLSFYGTTRPTLYAGTNGEIHFTSGTAYSNTSLPTATWPAAILPFWDDLDSSASTSEGVWWQTTGTSPNRKVIVEWLTRHYSTNGTNNTLRFQVQIDEGTYDIHFLYQDVTVGNGTYDYGASATVGIQGSTAYYNMFSYNSASLSNDLVFTFYHP